MTRLRFYPQGFGWTMGRPKIKKIMKTLMILVNPAQYDQGYEIVTFDI